MIRSLSPYYITTPWINPLGGAVLGESYTISIFVWNGLVTEPPVTATYEKTQENPAELIDSDRVNIARLISDFIEFEPQKTTTTEAIDGNNTLWVKTSIVYENDSTVQQVFIDTFSLGYAYGNEGENVPLSSTTLLTPQDYKVNRQGVFVLPVLAGGSTQDIIDFIIRVEADGGVVESPQCIDSNGSPFSMTATGAYKAGTLYSELSNAAIDDFAVSNNGGTRIDSDLLVKDRVANVPNISYLNGNGCPVVVRELQATNLIPDDVNLDPSSTWTNQSGVVVTPNNAISPSGDMNADLIDSSAGGTARVVVSISLLTSKTYIYSAYIKGVSGLVSKGAVLYVNIPDTGNIRLEYNQDTNVFTEIGIVDSGEEEMPNGWTRIWGSFTTTATVGSSVMQLNRAAGDSFVTNYYGVMVEEKQGSITTPSSLIHTSGVIATRNEDVITVDTNVAVTEIIETIGGVDQTPITVIPSTYQIPVGNINKVIMNH